MQPPSSTLIWLGSSSIMCGGPFHFRLGLILGWRRTGSGKNSFLLSWNGALEDNGNNPISFSSAMGIVHLRMKRMRNPVSPLPEMPLEQDGELHRTQHTTPNLAQLQLGISCGGGASSVGPHPCLERSCSIHCYHALSICFVNLKHTFGMLLF